MNNFFRMVIAVILTGLPASLAHAELPDEWKAWNRPVEPFRIVGNLYYVGANEIAAYLFTSPEGHVVLDGGFDETVPLIRTGIEKLGFRLEEVKILLNSHAHVDHAGGLARLRRLTGARLAASRGDAPLLEAGGEAEYPFPAVKVDRLLDDGESVVIGETSLTAHVTAGHTPGCTTWTTSIEEDGRAYDVIFLCSVNVFPGMDLLAEDPAYPGGRAAAFARSFDVLKSLPVDVFLGPHASFFLMHEKLNAESADRADRFVDPALYRRHVRAKRQRFEKVLAEQRRAKETDSGR